MSHVMMLWSAGHMFEYIFPMDYFRNHYSFFFSSPVPSSKKLLLTNYVSKSLTDTYWTYAPCISPTSSYLGNFLHILFQLVGSKHQLIHNNELPELYLNIETIKYNAASIFLVTPILPWIYCLVVQI